MLQSFNLCEQKKNERSALFICAQYLRFVRFCAIKFHLNRHRDTGIYCVRRSSFSEFLVLFLFWVLSYLDFCLFQNFFVTKKNFTTSSLCQKKPQWKRKILRNRCQRYFPILKVSYFSSSDNYSPKNQNYLCKVEKSFKFNFIWFYSILF